jgi:hypothetical protein
MSHTPGPWQYRANSHDTLFIVEGDGLLVTSMSWHSSIRERYPLRNESQANARLIAAAPELLEALQPFVEHNSSEDTITITVRTADVTRARAAIHRATGQEVQK